jgi:hypothetical protein
MSFSSSGAILLVALAEAEPLGAAGAGVLTRLTAMVQAFGLSDDPLVRQELANLVIHCLILTESGEDELDDDRSAEA